MANALYSDGGGAPTFAQDDTPTFGVETLVADPRRDLNFCSGACSTGSYWYPQTDLVGSGMVRADRVFASGFQ